MSPSKYFASRPPARKIPFLIGIDLHEVDGAVAAQAQRAGVPAADSAPTYHHVRWQHVGVLRLGPAERRERWPAAIGVSSRDERRRALLSSPTARTGRERLSRPSGKSLKTMGAFGILR